MNKIYISLPITGYSLEKQQAFSENAQWWLERHGFQAVNPFKNGLNEKAPYEAHIKRDLHLLTDCDGILLLDGWRGSKGCRLEHKVALACGLRIATTDMRVSKQIAMLKGEEDD